VSPLRLLALLALASAASGCRSKAKDGPSPGASGSALAAPVASGLPIPADAVARVVNGGNLPPYAGPVAKVRGVVRSTGDAPPELPEIVKQIPEDCELARKIYSHLFRVGPNRELADVLVAVTGYKAYVPERVPVETVEARSCSWGTRTLGLTFGQRIDVIAKDRRPYVPELMGGRMPAQIIAMPGGSASNLYPNSPGRYVLVDSMRIFATAEVYVLKYPTHDVTDEQGRYEIEGIPPGELTLNAFSPQTGETVEKKIKLEGGQTLELDLELPFDSKKHADTVARAAGAGKASASAAPSAPAVAPALSGKP
jgi:hypothetical protein